MNKKTMFILLLSFFSLIIPSQTNSQEGEIVDECLTNIQSPFILGDQTIKAFLTGDEVAEFRTTLYDGNTYRIILCSFESNLIEFSLYDTNRNLLFSNAEHEHTNVWDFMMEGSMECIVEARLNHEVGQSGMAMMLIGFKSSSGSKQ